MHSTNPLPLSIANKYFALRPHFWCHRCEPFASVWMVQMDVHRLLQKCRRKFSEKNGKHFWDAHVLPATEVWTLRQMKMTKNLWLRCSTHRFLTFVGFDLPSTMEMSVWSEWECDWSNAFGSELGSSTRRIEFRWVRWCTLELKVATETHD